LRHFQHGYGIALLELAPGSQGDLVVQHLEAVFPSGAVARVETGAPLRRIVATKGDASVDVYVGLPQAILRGPNVSLQGGPARSTRFVAPAHKDSTDLPAMHARAEILFEGERLEGFELLRLGRVRCFGKSVRIEPDVLPTALCVRGSRGLHEGLRALIGACESRCAELARYRADHPLRLGAVATSELPGLELAVILHQHLPRLADIAARRVAHPHELYGRLVTLHGALSAFGTPEIAPPYDHHDQGPAFRWLFERITHLVSVAARDRTTILQFGRVDASRFRLPFDRGDLAGKRPLLVLRGAEEEFLRDRVPSLLKMASPAAIKPLLNSAIRGVAVAVEFEPPEVVPRQEGVVAYRIDTRDKLWQDIEDRQFIELQLLGAPSSLEAFLYGIERVV
ncbi:MAG: type VI secretion system baseplate subunit TssK, partial [Polyangiaceae bacterium]